MLTIKNLYKVVGKEPHSKKWFVSSVDETPTQYWIYISLTNGTHLNRIDIERTPMNNGDEDLYEVWWWDNDPDPAHQIPIRELLNVRDLRLGVVPLLELIDYRLKLK